MWAIKIEDERLKIDARPLFNLRSFIFNLPYIVRFQRLSLPPLRLRLPEFLISIGGCRIGACYNARANFDEITEDLCKLLHPNGRCLTAVSTAI